jgi:colanic acid/amylovoran biosynthesis protein
MGERTKTLEDNRIRILIVNFHSSWNAGDDALVKEALHQLQASFPEASFTLIMDDPESYCGEGETLGSFTKWVKSSQAGTLGHWMWRRFPVFICSIFFSLLSYYICGYPWIPFVDKDNARLLKAYFSADLVISSAGNFLYSSGKIGLAYLLTVFSILFAWMIGKPVYALPQTLGPFKRKLDRCMARQVLSRLQLILVRDPISAGILQDWEIPEERWKLCPDIAFALTETARDEEALAILHRNGVILREDEPLLGITLTQWGAQSRWFKAQEAYEASIAAAVRSFVNNMGGRAVFFAQVQGPTIYEDDRVAARRVTVSLRDLGDRVVLIEEWCPYTVLRAMYGKMDLFLGTRLHSNIFALTAGVPVVAIAYQYKTRGILQMLNLDPWIIDIEEVSGDSLDQLIEEAWIRRDQLKRQIHDALIEIQRDAALAGTYIASHYVAFKSRG